jgi:hypothetical protein
MITSADPGRVLFLSVALKDGSMEAFHEVQEAVAHATELVKDDPETERAIFVAVPRARVHMAIRVDPVEPQTLPAPMTDTPLGGDWGKSPNFEPAPNGHDPAT